MITESPITMPIPAVGLWPGVDADSYHLWPLMSYSRLKGMNCPAKVFDRIQNPTDPTEAMIRGSVVDTCVTQPDLMNKLYVVPETCCAKKKDGAACENPGTVCIAGEWFCGVHLRSMGKANRHEAIRDAIIDSLILNGFKLTHKSPSGSLYYDREDGQKRRVSDHAPNQKTRRRLLADQREDIRIDLPPYGNDDPRQIVPQALLDKCLMMRDAVMAHEEAALIVSHAAVQMQLSGVFDDPDTGLRAKMRPDFYIPNIAVMADLKTSGIGASRDEFADAIFRNGYDFQSVMYPDGMKALGKPCDDFVFIVVEDESPFVVGVHRVGPATMEAARRKLKEYKALWKSCQISGEWAAYPGISDIEMSDYHLRRRGLTQDEIKELRTA